MSISLVDPVPDKYDNRPLGESRAHIQKNAEKGVPCPCCGQMVKIYRRKFSAGMAATLVAMYRELRLRERSGSPDPWIHVEHDLVETGKSPKRARDFSIMRFFGLIQPKARKTRTTGSTAEDTGYWTLTPLGRTCCEFPKRALIRKYVKTFDNTAQGFDGPEISVATALAGSKFKLIDLMAGEVAA